MCGKQLDLVRLSPSYLLHNISVNVQSIVIVLTRMIVALAMIVIMATILCSRKKKKKKAKKKDSNDLQKALVFDEKKDDEFGSSIGPSGDDFGQFANLDEKKAFYPPVMEPTPSAKRKREEALEKDKEKKIKEGFYQSRSDEDDTLEPIKSLKDEETDPADKSNASKKIIKVKSASYRADQSRKLKSYANSEKE
ncbi:Glycerol-3-phosphate dehydrogenase [Dirofilaria immitis]